MPTKVHVVKAMIFPVVMYGCDSWTIKKAECPRIDSSAHSLLYHPTLTSYMTIAKTIALTIWTFVGKVMNVSAFQYAV